MTVVPFGARVPSGVEPVLSEEHNQFRWEPLEVALTLLPFEPQRAALRRLQADVLDHPEAAHFYRAHPPA